LEEKIYRKHWRQWSKPRPRLLNRELGTRLVMKARAALLAAGLSEAETAAAMGDFSV
jgi:hypothetical protein